jgi:hypothetical protein
LVPIRSRLPSDNAFDPETIKLLTAAFEDAWKILDGSGTVGADEDPRRDKLARLIIIMAQDGERDPIKLWDDVLDSMRLSRG